MNNPEQLIAALKRLVESCEKDAGKATRGMKAGGVRLRAKMQRVRELAFEVRESTLKHRK